MQHHFLMPFATHKDARELACANSTNEVSDDTKLLALTQQQTLPPKEQYYIA